MQAQVGRKEGTDGEPGKPCQNIVNPPILWSWLN